MANSNNDLLSIELAKYRMAKNCLHKFHPAIIRAQNKAEEGILEGTTSNEERVSRLDLAIKQLQPVLQEQPSLVPNKLAYLTYYRKGDFKKPVEIRISRYIAQRFPSLKSNVVRDIAAYFETPLAHLIVTTTEEMVNAVMEGPYSCMRDWVSSNPHPYECYLPEYGWGVAVGVDIDKKIIMSRALVHIPTKTFVRSFERIPGDLDAEDSRESTSLNAWLFNEGYTKEESWPSGLLLKNIPDSYPYLDGEEKGVIQELHCLVLTDEGPDFILDNLYGEYSRTGSYCHGCDEICSQDDWSYEHECCVWCAEGIEDDVRVLSIDIECLWKHNPKTQLTSRTLVISPGGNYSITIDSVDEGETKELHYPSLGLHFRVNKYSPTSNPEEAPSNLLTLEYLEQHPVVVDALKEYLEDLPSLSVPPI